MCLTWYFPNSKINLHFPQKKNHIILYSCSFCFIPCRLVFKSFSIFLFHFCIPWQELMDLSILLYLLFANCYLLNIEINHGSNHPSISSSFLHLQQQIFFWKKESWMGRKRIMGLCSKLVDEELNIKWIMIYKLKKKKCSKFFFFFVTIVYSINIKWDSFFALENFNK
jgi:hypothetical protein